MNPFVSLCRQGPFFFDQKIVLKRTATILIGISGWTFRALQISQLCTLSRRRSVTAELSVEISSLPLLLVITLFRHYRKFITFNHSKGQLKVLEILNLLLRFALTWGYPERLVCPTVLCVRRETWQLDRFSWFFPFLYLFPLIWYFSYRSQPSKPIKCMLEVCSEDASSIKSCAKSKWLILQLPTVTLALTHWLGCECLSNSYRLWRGVVTAQTLVRDNGLPRSNGFHIILLAWIQTSDQEYKDLIVSGRWPSGPYSCKTPQSFFQGTWYNAFSIRKK